MSAPLFPRDEPDSSWDPGRSLGIIGLIFSVTGVAAGLFTLLLATLVALIGAIISVVALRRSRKAGHLNKFALAGVIVGFGTFLVWGGLVALALLRSAG